MRTDFRNTRIINNYANKVVKKNSQRLNKVDWLEISEGLLPKSSIQHYLARKIVMSNIDLANKRIMDLLNQAGISESKPLEIYEEALKIAKEKGNSADLIKIADRYVELHDLKPQKVQISETRKEIDYTNMLPSEVKRTISTTKNVENKQKDDEK